MTAKGGACYGTLERTSRTERCLLNISLGKKKRVVGNNHAQVNHFLFCPGAQAGLFNSGNALTLFFDRLANFCGFKRNH